jgi:hypothetical protein
MYREYDSTRFTVDSGEFFDSRHGSTSTQKSSLLPGRLVSDVVLIYTHGSHIPRCDLRIHMWMFGCRQLFHNRGLPGYEGALCGRSYADGIIMINLTAPIHANFTVCHWYGLHGVNQVAYLKIQLCKS